jgi:hypothetical protein
VWQAHRLGYRTLHKEDKHQDALCHLVLLPALNNVGVAQENLTVMYLKKYMVNDLWESLYWVLVVKRKDEELDLWVKILGETYNVFEDPTKTWASSTIPASTIKLHKRPQEVIMRGYK